MNSHTQKWITFLECHGKVAFFETISRIFIESKVKSWLTEGSRPTVHCGLQWRTIWPLMNHPNNIPFWSPLSICNPFLKSNLKNNEKKMKKLWKMILKITKKWRPEVLRLLEVSFKCGIKFFWKPMRYLIWPNVKNFHFVVPCTQTMAISV